MKRTAVTANTHALREMLRNSGDTRIQTSGPRNTALRGAVAETDHYVNACPCNRVRRSNRVQFRIWRRRRRVPQEPNPLGCISCSAQLSYLSMKVGYTESRIILGPD